MMGTAHAATGLLLATATRPLADTIGADTTLWYTAWVGGCMLPDLDMSVSHPARVWGPPTQLLGGLIGDLAGGHRGETHNAARFPLGILTAGLAAVATLSAAVDYLRPIATHTLNPSLTTITGWLHQAAAHHTPISDHLATATRAIPTPATHTTITPTEWALAAAACIPVLAVALIIGISLRMVGGKAIPPLRNPAINFTTAITITITAADGPLYWAPLIVAAGTLAHMTGDLITEEGIPRPTLTRPLSRERVSLGLFRTDSTIGHATTPLLLAATAYLLWAH